MGYQPYEQPLMMLQQVPQVPQMPIQGQRITDRVVFLGQAIPPMFAMPHPSIMPN
jgi:hypothetical protein